MKKLLNNFRGILLFRSLSKNKSINKAQIKNIYSSSLIRVSLLITLLFSNAVSTSGRSLDLRIEDHIKRPKGFSIQNAKKLSEQEIFEGAQKAIHDPEIVWEYFENIAFGSEFSSDTSGDRIKKWDQDIYIFVAGENVLYHKLMMADFVRKLNSILPINMSFHDANKHTVKANIGVFFVRDFEEAIFRTYRKGFEDLSLRIVNNKNYLKNKYIAMRNEQSMRAFANCLYGQKLEMIFSIIFVSLTLNQNEDLEGAFKEELYQVLGLGNDARHLKYTRFNDRDIVKEPTALDWLLLKILYHEKIKPGMTKEEVKAIFLEVYQEVYVKEMKHE